MKAIVIKPKNSSEVKFLSELLKKLGITANAMDIEEIEDQGLAFLMKNADRNKKVSREDVMKKLKA
jgi:hypothetical protein